MKRHLPERLAALQMRKYVPLFLLLLAVAGIGAFMLAKSRPTTGPGSLPETGIDAGLPPAPADAESRPATDTVSLDAINAKWTGDLDGMEKRRLIRVLTVYSKTAFFIDGGTPRGTTYDLMKAFEDEFNRKRKKGVLHVNVVFVPVPRDELLTGLVEGRGDVALANLTITDERKKLVAFTEPAYTNASEIVVTGPEGPAITGLADLQGQTVFVQKSSSYAESLEKLNTEFAQQGKKVISIRAVPENLDYEDVLEMVNAGLIGMTVIDQHIAEFWKQIFPDITLRTGIALRSGGHIAWAVRKNSPRFLEELNSFVQTHRAGTLFGNVTLRKYLKDVKYVKNATTEAETKKLRDLMTNFQKYGEQYRVDWLLMAAQGYQESRLDQNVKSPVGAIGIMQVMPATAQELNVGDITQPETNIHAGVKYMRFMVDQYYKDEPMDDFNRLMFAFASYNAGAARIRGLRKEAEQRGLNPNVWFGNVERVAAEKIGRETTQYVSNIYKYYIAYSLALEQHQERQVTREALRD